MTRRNTLTTAAVLLAAALAAGLLPGCTEAPQEPAFDNPFDPDGPTGGDPFDVIATRTGNVIFVVWTAVDNDAISTYDVLHALSADGPFSIAGSVDATMTSFQHEEFAPNAGNWYKVIAVDAFGAATAATPVQAASILPPATVSYAAGATTPSRMAEITIATAAGDRVELDSLPGFPDPLSVPFEADGDTTVVWDLGASAASGEVKYLYTRVFTGEAASATRLDSIEVTFAPAMGWDAPGQTLASRTTPILIGGTGGATRMRFATDRVGLETADWLPGDGVFEDWTLSAEPDSQVIFAEFESDFGFTITDSIWAVPDTLDVVEVTLNGDAPDVQGDLLSLAVDAAATDMRYALDLEVLAGTAWEPYEPTVQFPHDGCASDVLKTLYVQLRNDWVPEGDVYSRTVTWIPPEALGVHFAEPDSVDVGAAVTLTGTAVRGTCSDPLDLVEVDWGEGWTAAAGLESWSLDWTAPAMADTVEMTARVTAGDETAIREFMVYVIEP